MDVNVAVPAVCREGWGTGLSGRTGPRPLTVVAVAGLHCAAVCALGLVFEARRVPVPPAEIGMPVVFVPAAPPQAEPQPHIVASSTMEVAADQEPATLAPLPSMAVPPSEQGLAPRHRPIRHDTKHAPPPHISPTQASNALPPVTPPAQTAIVQHAATPAGAPSHEPARALTIWEAQIRQAVQDAAAYPASARLLRREGSAQVRFDYDRGTIEQAAVAQTSHVAALDTAAVAAVTRAVIPDPPAELGPQRRTMLVWVQFRLMQEE